MPIFKNNSDPFNTAVTIKRTPKDAAVTRGSDTFYFRYYRQMNNRYVRMPWYHSLGESVFIRCQIEANAEGYIYGNTSGANIYVYKNGSTHQIQWRNGTTVLLSIACDDKRHDIGFVGVIPDLSTFVGRKMYPFCDGVTYDTIEITTTVSPYNARVGGVIDGTTNSACIHSSGAWAIRIYEVYANSFMFDDQKALYTFDMYPANYNASATDGTMVDIRDSHENGTTVNGSAAGGTSTSSTENFPEEGYGVQLHDIRFITNSGYDNIVPILAEDGGVDGDAGFQSDGTAAGQADYPASLTQSSDVRKFAFCLSGMPRPSGWTYAEFNPSISGGFNYAVGELHHGRTPKWSIWNDVIDFGFYIDEYGYMGFNLLKRMVGSGYDGGPAFCRTKTIGAPLHYFDQYNTDRNCIHAPYIRFSDDVLQVNLHNGAMLRTQIADIGAGDINAYITHLGRKPYDSEMIYDLNESLGGQVSYRLGNLAPWNRTYDEMQNVGWIPMGVKLSLTLTEQGSEVFVESKEHKETSAPYLTSGASQAVKNAYRINGWTDELVVTSSPERKWRLLDLIMNYSESNPLPLWAKMTMITGVAAINNSIDCSRLVASRKCSMYAVYEPKIDGTSGAGERDENWDSTDQTYRENWRNTDAPNYRMVMKPEGGLNICNVYGCWFSTNFINETYSPCMKTRFDYDADSGGALKIFTTLSLPIIGCTTDSEGNITALDQNATNYMGLVELFYYDNGAYKYTAAIKKSITKVQLEASFSGDYTKWYGPAAASTWIGNNPTSPYALWKNGKRQYGYYTSSSASAILGTPEECKNIDAHNTSSGHLYDKVRFIAVNGYDFNIPRTANNFALPKDATAVCHVYNLSTVPVLVAYDNALWDAKHHHVIFPDCGTPLSSQRTYEMADSWMQFTPSSGSVTLELYFRAFTRSGSDYVAANPVMVPNVTSSNNSGKITIRRYNASGVEQSTTTDYVYNLLSKSGSTPLTYTKQILGLDGVIYDDCYRLQKSFSNIQTGDYFIVSIHS